MSLVSARGTGDPISGILSNAPGVLEPGDGPPSTGLAGFDAVLQFSVAILQAQIAQTLGQLDLSASVPWGSIPLPASLLALIPPDVLRTLSERVGVSLQLRLTDPYVAGLRWPTEVTIGTGGVSLQPEIGLNNQRIVDIGWQLQINIVTAQLSNAPLLFATTSGSAAGAGSAVGGTTVSAAGGAATGASSSGGPPLATGTAITPALASVAIWPTIWRFAEALDFTNTTATATSNTQGVTDFLATSGGQTLLNQALVRLKAVSGVSLSPDIAPAGPISAAIAKAAALPTLQVLDLLLQDASGNSVLCLCVSLDTPAGGTPQLVQPFLEGLDFAYGVSAKLLSYALKARWIGAAGGVSIVGETQVELGTKGATGVAKVMVTFGPTLSDVAIVASAAASGDLLRLLGTQTIQLLELWDQNGNQVTNLGSLGTPQTQPFVLPVNYFDAGDGPQTLQGNFENLLFHLMVIVGFPVLDAFAIDAGSVAGFTSSPMQALFVRWALVRRLLRPPTIFGGALGGGSAGTLGESLQ
jgi:hypothetical protein